MKLLHKIHSRTCSLAFECFDPAESLWCMSVVQQNVRFYFSLFGCSYILALVYVEICGMCCSIKADLLQYFSATIYLHI